MMAYKAVSCRFNMQDEEERKLYNMVEQKAKDYSTISGCIKAILREYFAGESSDIALLLEQNTQKILDFINEKSFASDTCSSKQKSELPDCSDVIPDNLGSILDKFI